MVVELTMVAVLSLEGTLPGTCARLLTPSCGGPTPAKALVPASRVIQFDDAEGNMALRQRVIYLRQVLRRSGRVIKLPDGQQFCEIRKGNKTST